jgi:predicted P-loop ATPase
MSASKWPDRTKAGAVDIRSWRNVAEFIKRAGIVVRRNEFTGYDEVNGKALDDDLLIQLLDEAHQEGLRVGRDFLLERLKATALDNRYHPVRDYFRGLKWDRKPRVDRWLTAYLGVEDDDYVRAVARCTLIAAVRRIMKPGTKFDNLLVLEGPQGQGKSSLIAILAIKQDWFTDAVSLTDDGKVMIEQTSGKMIVEVAELNGMRKASVEHIKASLSRTHDRARLAYGRLTTEVPRQFIMFATVNTDDEDEAKYLKDNTGNRRFWPVLCECEEADFDALKRDLDQIWAEAVAREAKGESVVLPKELWEVAGEEQEARMEENPYYDALKNELGDITGKVLIEDVWDFLRKAPKDRASYDEKKLGSAMRKLGFNRVTLRVGGGVRKKHYVKRSAKNPNAPLATIKLTTRRRLQAVRDVQE